MINVNSDIDTESRLELAILLLNENGDILDAHPSCTDSLDWTREDLLGQNIQSILQSGRDVLLTRLFEVQAGDRDPTGDTTFSVRVGIRKKGGDVFTAVVTVKRFLRLGCWTATIHPWNTEEPIPQEECAETVRSEAGSDGVLAQKDDASAFYNQFDLGADIVRPSFRNTSLLTPTTALKLNVRAESEFTNLTPPGVNETSSAASVEEPGSSILDEPDAVTEDLGLDRRDESKPEDRASALSAHFQTLLREVNETLEAERSYQKKIQQLEERENIRLVELAQLRMELEQANAKRLTAEGQLSGLIQENASLRIDQRQLGEAQNTLRNIRDEVEAQLHACRTALRETRQTLDEQTMEKQKLELLLNSTRLDLEAKCEDWRLESEKLKVALELMRIEQRVDQAGTRDEEI